MGMCGGYCPTDVHLIIIIIIISQDMSLTHLFPSQVTSMRFDSELTYVSK